MNIFVAPFINALFVAYNLVGSWGWAVVLLTVLIRLILIPLVIPSFKSAKKMRDLQPKLNKLKEKYSKDKEGLAKAQMDLYRNEGVNPLGGCLPQLLQVAVLILFFSAFNTVGMFADGKGNVEAVNSSLIPALRINNDFKIDPYFLGTNLVSTPAKVFEGGVGLNMVLPLILLVGSGVLQYLSAKLMMPNTKSSEAVVKATKDKEDDMMAAMRTQSTYFMPLMTIFIGWNFSLGILLYWFINSLLMLVQQVMMEKIK